MAEISPGSVKKENFSLSGNAEIENVYYDLETDTLTVLLSESDSYLESYTLTSTAVAGSISKTCDLTVEKQQEYNTVGILKTEISENTAYITLYNSTYEDKEVTIYVCDSEGNVLSEVPASVNAEDTATVTANVSEFSETDITFKL